MTRVIAWLVGMGIAAAGCQEPVQELPAATELGAVVDTVHVVGDVAYWIERSRGAPGVRLRRYQAGTIQTVDDLPQFDPIPDHGWPTMAATDTTAVWGFGNPFLGGCLGRSVQLGAPGVDLGLYADQCPIGPIAIREHTLTFLSTPGFAYIAIMQADLGSGVVTEHARLEGSPDGLGVVHDDRAYLLLTHETAEGPVGVVAALDLRTPSAPLEIVSAPIAGRNLPGGRFAVGDGWVAWLDGDTPIDESPAEPWRVIVRGASGDVATELPSAAYSLTAAGGALWMLEKPEDPFIPRTHVLRVPDGSAPASGTTTFAFGPDVGPDGASAIYGFGDDLLVRTPDGRLLLQPLP